MQDKPFALVGVNSDDLKRAKQAIADNGLNWRSFQNSVEGKNEISADWFVQGWPTIVVLDAQRKIRYRGHDGVKASEVAKKLVEEEVASRD